MMNALVAQSGGSSPALNASLSGVFDACRAYPDRISRVLGAWHGIEGVLQEELIDLSAQDPAEMALLKTSPAAGAIGTCRYKLDPSQTADFSRIVDVIKAHNIGFFFYIGGNDSMDTAARVSALARTRGVDLVVTGVPKTIDNDVGDTEMRIVDHTPGFGSAARYWAYLIQNMDEENRGMATSECVLVLQAMGRKAGFITAASRLGDPERRMPLQLYPAESGHTLESLLERVNAELSRRGRVIVVVNEGFNVGSLGERRDAFGHIEYGASSTSAAQVVTNYLNAHTLAARGQATVQVPGVIQRSVSAFASRTDLEEAYRVGMKAVEIAMTEGTGWMATIRRAASDPYAAFYDKVALEAVAGSERFLPKSWLTRDGTDVTDDFIDYAAPLIGDGWPEVRLENGLQRFARLRIAFVDRKLPAYVPQKF